MKLGRTLFLPCIRNEILKKHFISHLQFSILWLLFILIGRYIICILCCSATKWVWLAVFQVLQCIQIGDILGAV